MRWFLNPWIFSQPPSEPPQLIKRVSLHDATATLFTNNGVVVGNIRTQANIHVGQTLILGLFTNF